MKMSSKSTKLDRLARLPGYQGARSSARNQADNDKLATGMNQIKRQHSSSGICNDRNRPSQTTKCTSPASSASKRGPSHQTGQSKGLISKSEVKKPVNGKTDALSGVKRPLESPDSGPKQSKREVSKRSRREVSSSEEDFPALPAQVEAPWPKFLVVSAKEGSLRGVSGIRICMQLNQMLQKFDCKRQRTGSLLIQTFAKPDSDKLLESSKLFGRDVEVKPHGFFNTCKGVIRSWESPSCTDDELNEWFQSHNIQSFYRLSKRKDSESESLVLTFQGTTLPEAATVGFERCRVRPFIPNPRRCFRCQRFGHISKVCSRTEVCAQCGSSDHTHTRDTPCTAEPMCVNCGEQHPAFDRLCPRFKIEKEAQRLRIVQSIPLTQALRLAEQSAGQPVTYATTVAFSAPVSGPTTSGLQRSAPRTRVSLDPKYKYCKTPNHTKMDNLHQSGNKETQVSTLSEKTETDNDETNSLSSQESGHLMAQDEDHTTNQSSSESEESEDESTSPIHDSQKDTDRKSEVDTGCSAEAISSDKDSETCEKEYNKKVTAFFLTGLGLTKAAEQVRIRPYDPSKVVTNEYSLKSTSMIYSHTYKNDQNMVLFELYYRQMHTMVVRIGNYFQKNVDESPVEIFEQSTSH